LKEHIAVGMKLHGISLMGPTPSLAQVFEEHSEIFSAIEAGDAERARELMSKHLIGSRDRMFEGRLLDLGLK
jgi:GntR family transcriptional regulator, transcriptional repressor for pyruvate dehydrogenase complex